MGSNQMAATTDRRENADCADLRIVPTLGRFACFTDKRDLVDATYTEVGDPPGVPLEAAADAADPLLSALEALLPLDEDRIRDWRLLSPSSAWPRPTPHSPQNNAPASPQRAPASSKPQRQRRKRVICGRASTPRPPGGSCWPSSWAGAPRPGRLDRKSHPRQAAPRTD